MSRRWVVTVRTRDGDRLLEVPDNANLREAFLREGVSPYRGLARLTNCRGRARCGTCRVTVVAGADALSAPTPFEQARLPGAEPTDRLACQANVRGAVCVQLR